MFEAAELGHTLDKNAYDAQLPGLRTELLEAQYEFEQRRSFATLIVVAGVEAAGRGDAVNTLTSWIDPRHVHSSAAGAVPRASRVAGGSGALQGMTGDGGRPPMARFWRELPARGRIGVFFGGWYEPLLVARAEGTLGKAGFERGLERVRRLEQMLADDGVLILKFWFHLSRDQQRARFDQLARDPKTAWRATGKRRAQRYDAVVTTAERMVRETSLASAPWHVIESADPRYRDLTFGKKVLGCLRHRLEVEPVAPAGDTVAPELAGAARPDGGGDSDGAADLLESLPLDRTVGKGEYDARLPRLQGKLAALTARRAFRRRSLLCVFEGPDAAGKGGAIRRITSALDVRAWRLHPIEAPTDEERAQPYQWRFWRKLPDAGHVALFDRSWYGRVLVERVEGFAAPGDVERAYAEINDFEEQLAESGAIVLKFWIQIGKGEQHERFVARESTGFKRFKLTADDWRNRERWDDYQAAAGEMIARTSTATAPWTLVEGNDKRFARLQILKTIVRRLRDGA